MTTEVRLFPEQEARVEIDAMLEAAGWIIQDYRKRNLRAARGVAVREFPTARGPADYVLYVDRKAIGSFEAKKKGKTLRDVEPQGDRYALGFKETAAVNGLPAWRELLPFHYVSAGAETLFASRIDPVLKPREVFNFYCPRRSCGGCRPSRPCARACGPCGRWTPQGCAKRRSSRLQRRSTRGGRTRRRCAGRPREWQRAGVADGRE